MTNRGAANPRYANGARRRALAARVKAMGMPCWICGLPIDPMRKAGDPLSFELDELVPVSKGGSPVDFENTAGSHRACNQWRGDKSMARVEAVRTEVRARFGPWSSALAFCEGARAVLRADNARSGHTPVRHPKRASGAL